MSSESTSQKKGMPTWLFTSVGVAAIGGIAFVANLIARQVPIQVDMTANNFYSLSKGTKAILEKLDTKVNATLFVSDPSDDLPPSMAGRVRDVENMLLQFEKYSDKIAFKRVIPSPATDEEDQARLAGVGPRRTPQGAFYFGIGVTCLDRSHAIEFVPDVPEEQLEYELARAITNVFNSKKKVVGVMSALQVGGGFGNPMNPMGGGSRAWVLHQQLSQNYEVKSVEMTADKIDDTIDVLFVIHPAGITDTAEYAIDQFIMKGKRVIAFLDPECIAADSGGRPPMGGGGQTSSSFNKLLGHWGYSFDSGQVVADMLYKTAMRGGAENPGVLTLPKQAINEKSIITGQLSDVTMVLAGGFTGKPTEGLMEEWLIKTSPKNQLVSGMELKRDVGPEFETKFKSDDRERYLALSLTGKFKSAFSEKPKKDDSANKDEDKKEQPKTDNAEHLKESKEGAAVVLVGDADFAWDNFCVQMVGPGMAIPFNNNLGLALNMVDYLAGDTNLIQIRSRASGRRPFTKINEIEQAAQAKIQAETQALQEKADAASKKITELQAKKDPKAQMMLSPEQQAEITKFRKEEAEANKARRQKLKDAMREIDGTKTWLKFANIAIMPFLVLCVGVAISIVNRRKHSAR